MTQEREEEGEKTLIKTEKLNELEREGTQAQKDKESKREGEM